MSAGNIKLNLKEFSHVKSDKNSTTLKHKNGHQLILAHGSLSPESRTQLEELAKVGNPKLEESKKTPPKAKMAEGGQPRWDQETAPAPADPHQSNDADYHDKTTSEQDTARHKQADTEEQRGKSMGLYAKGGSINNPAEGLDFSTEKKEDEAAYNAGLPCLNPHCKSHGKPHPNCRCYSGGEAYAKGGYVEGHDNNNPSAKEEYFCDMPRHHYKGCEYVMAHGGEVSQQGNDVRHAMKEKQRGNSGAAQQQMNFAKSEAKGRAQFEREAIKPKMKGLADGGKPEEADDVPAMQDVERGFHHQYIEPDKEESQDEQNKGIDKEIEDASSFANPDKESITSPVASEDQPQQGLAQVPEQQSDQNGYQPLPQAADAQHQQGNYNPNDTNPIQRFQNAAQYYDYKKNEVINEGMQEGQAWLKDLQDGHIKPMTYRSLFHSESTPQKISTLFGLLVSGAGSGLTHQSNAVMDMMKQTIDNDLQGQIRSKENAVNYLRLGQQHEANKANIGNVNQEANAKAIANAKVRMNWSLFHDQMQKIQAMPEGKAKQDAMAQMAVMNQAIQTDNYDILSRMGSAAAAAHVMGLTNGASGQGGEAAFQNRNKLMGSGMMGDVGKNVADFEVSRHIPGIAGQASRPVTQEDSKRIQGMNVLDNKVRDVLDFAQKHRGSLNPETLKQAKQKAEELTAFYNQSIDGLGLTQGRLNWLDEQIKKNPTSIIGQILGNNATLREIRDSNAKRRDLLLSGPGGYGFPQQPQQSKSGRPMQMNKKTGKWEYK